MTDAQPPAAKHHLLICSVGGTPEPIAAAIRNWQPERVMFFHSEQTRASIKAALDSVAGGGLRIPPGCTEQTVLSDPQDLQQTLRELRALDQHVQSWWQRGENYAIVVDFTGGTKVMSAALALVARRWKCTFAYVGGQERNKDGVGAVVTGREQQFSQLNPWDALGYQSVESAVAVFNNGGYAAAAALLDGALRNTDAPEVKRELSTLKAVVDAYAAWDRFEHKSAAQRFADALKNRNDLTVMFAHEAQSLIQRLECHRGRVERLASQKEPTTEWVTDLLHNACRRAGEHRFDDAVARLYRAIEALAQVRLREQHRIPDTADVSLEQLPCALHAAWSNRGANGRHFKLGLQDTYCALEEFGDELGRQFFELGLADVQKSPLVARNQSILAHGFQPVGQAVYDELFGKLSVLMPSEPADSWLLPTPR